MTNPRLVAAMKAALKKYPLNEFDWTIPSDCPITIPKNLKNGYERNVYLKENLYKNVTEDEPFPLHYWTIQRWGKIGSFKRNPKNDARITKFISELQKGKLTRLSFNCISSLSKVASFIHPCTYAIYDSRVIYSLNWLLISQTDERELYPQPAGRSAALAQYDLQTIVRLAGQKHSYKSHKSAFHDYCGLMRKLATEVFGPNSKPYKAEMLLFSIAPNWVVGNIKSRVSVSIRNNA